MTRETVLRSFIVWLGFYYARNLMKISSPGVMRFVPPWSCGTLGILQTCPDVFLEPFFFIVGLGTFRPVNRNGWGKMREIKLWRTFFSGRFRADGANLFQTGIHRNAVLHATVICEDSIKSHAGMGLRWTGFEPATFRL